ncbi:MAG: phosphoribosylglycinamide formyltransferase [Solitalea sp.]
MTKTKRIAIFASGSGSNAQRIIEHFNENKEAEVAIILSNRPDAFVLERADNHEIPTHVFDREEFYRTDRIVTLLQNLQIDLVVLAGFLWLIPQNLLEAFPRRIINIHPALLPKYGGKGMYGDFVHRAVMDAGETESGITIHYVNEVYDSGDIIYQAHFKIEPDDNLDMIRYKAQQLEHLHYPRIIQKLVAGSGQ